MIRSGEKRPILKSLVAILLIAGCLWASQWQFHRGEDRKARNSTIEAHIDIPAVDLNSLTDNVKAHEWRAITTTGTFDSNQQILLRNRYFEGKYGYAVLTRFTTEGADSIWVDRGWVAAGASATIAPDTPEVPSGVVSITARLRLDSSLPSGSFFGPHLAYAVQWVLFAGLVVYGRYLIRKMDLTSGEVLSSKEL